MNRKAEILFRLGEPFLAGLYEDENAPVVERFGRALRRYFEAAKPEVHGLLYPAPDQNLWRLAGKLGRFHYANGFEIDANGLRQAAEERLANPFEKKLLATVVAELEFFCLSLIPPRYRLGGNGWTHSILDYRRLLAEGLDAYGVRVQALPASPLQRALADVFAGLDGFVGQLPPAFADAIRQPARDFAGAMRSFNFFAALDQYDSVGRFNEYMGEYYRGEPDAEEYLAVLYEAFDRHAGWHFLFTGKHPAFSALCIRAQRTRRPNSGFLAQADTPPEVWDAVFDNWARGMPCPAIYNGEAYRDAVISVTGAPEELRDRFAFGGCTELMFDGCSNVGSIDAGVHLLEIYAHARDFADFKERVAEHVAEIGRVIAAHAEHVSHWRPQLIRTLFIDDCLERGVEYHAGGARVNGSVVDVVGLTDVANAEAAARGLDEKFGNDQDGVDAIAREVALHVFDLIRRQPGRHGGFCCPGIIMFNTFAGLGAYVPATAGRADGAPVVDSVGATTGTDRRGPTALLNSVAKLPSAMGLGTLVLNLRLSPALAAPGQRGTLRALVEGFFRQGGLHLQPTLIDAETMRRALAKPEDFPNLVVRIGGYSEYFQRLDRTLQMEVARRIEH